MNKKEHSCHPQSAAGRRALSRAALRTAILLLMLTLLLSGCRRKKPQGSPAPSSQTTQQTLTLLPDDQPALTETEPAETPAQEPEAEPTDAPAQEPETEPAEAPAQEPEVEPAAAPSQEPEAEPAAQEPEPDAASFAIDEDGTYNSKDDVALYLYTYHHLPDNYITKKEAKALGWTGGSVEVYAPGKSIGGDYFGNYEGQLPKKKGREYRECDIDTLGWKDRGSRRIIYSNDGLIYYTHNHYKTFTLLYDSDGPVE